MVVLNKNTGILEKRCESYTLQDIEKPNLYKDIFNYDEIPKCVFDYKNIPISPAKNFWITDTTFRDGQQSRVPYTVDQILKLYDFLHLLGGEKGIIRQTEFFLYSDKDKEAALGCMERGYKFPEVTGWIRPLSKDLELVKDFGLKEVGFLVSSSDYHIFKKLNKTRQQAMEDYMSIIRKAVELEIKPRCHFEDITRSDFYGFVLPFANELQKLMVESGTPVKIRLCDTMGYGVSYPGASLPRSVPEIIYSLRTLAGFDSELLEWHGHNDFYRSVSNAATAWLYGCSGVNCSLLGIGERTGNTPLEAMVIEYAQLRGTLDGMEVSVITDIARYFEKELDYIIPPMTPFVGKSFNVTQAGIHADGLLKNEEIYNIFNTGKLLKRPVGVSVTQTSGLAGITLWINNNLMLDKNSKLDKKDPRVKKIKDWVDVQYQSGRVTPISDVEMIETIRAIAPDIFILTM